MDKKVTIPEIITVRDLADLLGVTPINVIKTLIKNGVIANINQQIDFDTAAFVASEFGFEAQLPFSEPEVSESEQLAPWQILTQGEDASKLKPRPPVVTILGHVDHGKTSLLDAIRRTNVVAQESGGITQHIGAYQVVHNGRRITFLDTPGHEAFTAMRARGAHITDIAVLVVAADDGVMPQTIEALNHARAAHVPIIVALNKIDKPNARPDFVKQQLAENGLVPDEWGGNTMLIPVSAKQKIGIEDLLEAILLVADEMGVCANPDRMAYGTVLESKLDKRMGPVATVLVQNGTLHVGDHFCMGLTYGRVRALYDENGRRLKEAGPGTPVVIVGLSEVARPGDHLEGVADERTARAITQKRQEEAREQAQAAQRRVLSLDDWAARVREGQATELALVLKADVQGSIEPIVDSLKQLKVPEVRLNIIHTGTGNITESDVNLAVASNAIIVGFRVDIDPAGHRAAEMEHLQIQLYDVIYELVDDIEKAMKGLLAPTYVEAVIGHAEVRQIFDIPSVGRVAGCFVTDGVVRRNAKVRVLRGDTLVFQGEVASLRRFDKDMREVRENFECGVRIHNFNEVQVGDRLEFYAMEREKTE